ncbi:MAG: NAD/FAD-binding protein [Rhizobiales bacterium NRL2]|jgi:predicted NAD/FAD-binding protein|nr:MAG: NAD/FAD-binding protein [Rhizobiales bacterium NRL2]
MTAGLPFGSRIAVVGAGISGLSAAWLLAGNYRVTVYDRAEYAGGHANTVDVDDGGSAVPVDTGFIVYNDRNYPNLCALFDMLRVDTAPSDMSFSVSAEGGRFEYGAARPSMLFAQTSNLASPRFYRMLRDIGRFHRAGRAHLAGGGEATLGQFLDRHGFGPELVSRHVLPMGAAIWSTPAARMLDFPAAAFFRFMDNHGLLGLADRPRWRTVRGGSRAYVEALTEGFRDRVRLNTGVEAITRTPEGVRVEDRQDGVEIHDAVIMACHADEALGLIKDADGAERRVLGGFRYQRNLAVLHSDPAFMPRRRRAWASWNYLLGEDADNRAPSVTYWMNRLQPLATRRELFVTLNPADQPADGTVLRSFPYDHPVFDGEAAAMQKMVWNIQGARGLWFCGAHLGYGFHEDGIQSGLAVAEGLSGLRRPWRVDDESGRLQIPAGWPELLAARRRAA